MRAPLDSEAPPAPDGAEMRASSGTGLRRLPSTTECSHEATRNRRERLREAGFRTDQFAGEGPELDPADLAGSIEGFVGYARIPLGIAGPLKIRGGAAEGEFFVPLATTEGTLVASFQHAFNAIGRCGGAVALCTAQRVGRAPCFEFASLPDAAAFVAWLRTQTSALADAVSARSRYARLVDVHASIVGDTVYVLFEFTTGDAAGQNMVTAAAQAICEHLLAHSPVTPRSWLLESVLSADKRASALPFLRGARGHNASAELLLPAKQIERYWRADPARFVKAWTQASVGALQTGTTGLQGNVANALAALFIACGQDVACIAEASTALTRVEARPGGDVYVSITLPNLIVGTVGGGTYLPTAQESLGLLGCVGAGHARKFAEICAAVALAGELALVGAMASGQFASAHAAGGRKGRGTSECAR